MVGKLADPQASIQDKEKGDQIARKAASEGKKEKSVCSLFFSLSAAEEYGVKKKPLTRVVKLGANTDGLAGLRSYRRQRCRSPQKNNNHPQN
jgi:hypothetical protein